MDLFKDIWETYKDRIKSPFVVSFLISWTMCNWLFVYTFFSFPVEYNYFTKVKFINDYVQLHQGYNLFWKPLWVSSLATLVYIVCSGFYLVMFSFYKTTVKSWIFGFTSRGENVPKEYFLSVQMRYLKLREDNEKMNGDLIVAEKQVEELNQRLQNIVIEDFSAKDKLMKAEKRNMEMEKEIDRMLGEKTFKELSIQRFEAIFMNQKSWHILIKDSQEKITTQEIMFENERQVKDMSNLKIKYQVEEISSTKDEILISFALLNVSNKAERILYYLMEFSTGYFKGFSTIGNGRNDVRVTQNSLGKDLQDFFK